MANLKALFKPNKWLKFIFFSNAIVVFGASSFLLGLRSANFTIFEINDVHFINPNLRKHLCCYDPTLISVFENRLIDTLKQIKPPYSNEVLNGAITNLREGSYMKKYFRVLNVNSISYKILVLLDNNPAHTLTSFEIITPKSTYFLKPLRIIKDLNPEF